MAAVVANRDSALMELVCSGDGTWILTVCVGSTVRGAGIWPSKPMWLEQTFSSFVGILDSILRPVRIPSKNVKPGT